MRSIPIVTFDTSAHNRLTDDGFRANRVLAKISADMFFRFSGLAIEELYATKDSSRRAEPLASCRRLQEGESDCLYPHNEVLKLLIEAHSKETGIFNWLTVDVTSGEYANEIGTGNLVDDDSLIVEHRAEHFSTLRQYRQMFAQLRPLLQPVFEAHGETRPRTYKDFLRQLENSDELLIAGFAKFLYDRVASSDLPKDAVLKFLDACPPFRAVNYALLMSWFDLAVGDEAGERFESGRNDLFMAIYLPYCDKFVTAEKKGEQEKCLQEIVSVAGLGTEVLSYEVFCDSLA